MPLSLHFPEKEILLPILLSFYFRRIKLGSHDKKIIPAQRTRQMMIPNTQDKSIKFVCLWQMRMFYSENHNIVLDGRDGWNFYMLFFFSSSFLPTFCVSVCRFLFFLFMLLSRKTTIKSNEIGSFLRILFLGIFN